MCASSMCGASRPSSNSDDPSPVPSGITISTPVPLMAPRPCMSASLMTMAGLPVCFAIARCRSKPFHSSEPRFALNSVLPLRTGPGKPTDTRSNGGSRAVNSFSFSRSRAGGHGFGVSTRARSVIISPRSSSSEAFNPVPPMSNARVFNPLAGFLAEVFLALFFLIVFFGAIIFSCTTLREFVVKFFPPKYYLTHYRLRRRPDHATNQEALSAGPRIRRSHAIRIDAARTSGRGEANRAANGSNFRPRQPARQIARTRALQRAVRSDGRKILRTERLFRFGQFDLERGLLSTRDGEDASDESRRRRLHRRRAGSELLLHRANQARHRFYH